MHFQSSPGPNDSVLKFLLFSKTGKTSVNYTEPNQGWISDS